MIHLCHAEGCDLLVKPERLMCLRHWRMVPRELQRDVWAHYVAGQEKTKRPTREYLAAAAAAVAAVAEKESR